MARQNEYAGLRGGQKQMWLRQHRDEILEYMAKHNKGAAMLKFGIAHPGTLDRLVKRETESEQRPTRFEVMKAQGLATTSLEMSRESQKQLRELKEAFQTFAESVGEQIASKFLLPLLHSVIQPPPGLELAPDDRLNLETLFGSKLELPAARNYDVLAQAEEIVPGSEDPSLETGKPDWYLLYWWNELPIEGRSLWCQCEDLEERLPSQFHEAVDREDWKRALLLYMAHHQRPWLPYKELDVDTLESNWEQGQPRQFITEARKWITEVEMLLRPPGIG